MFDEKTPLLKQLNPNELVNSRSHTRPPLLKRLGSVVVVTFRIIISTVLAPGKYLIACFYDEQGHFSAFAPAYRVGRGLSRRRNKRPRQGATISARSEQNENRAHESSGKSFKSSPSDSLQGSSTGRASSVLSGDRELKETRNVPQYQDGDSSYGDSSARHTRSRPVPPPAAEDSDVPAPKRSIRIKVVNEDALKQRRERREQRATLTNSSDGLQPPLTAATIKSPTGPTSSLRLTRYPRAPAPPRPLIPRRQPSYTLANPPSFGPPQKTLIIDLDETLIHSICKGGRMSTGHMVEVKLDMSMGIGGPGQGVPILYYVHKRPHCDEFLRKVSKWYNLIVFTASVQEYADPVIDWLELERKYFSARYYRQHCTYRGGAYIKDLSTVEPDLSKVMILDNSPMSYQFHGDNAIPIEGWISDPTDNDLIHLIPLLEGLQYTTDVRALLALRLGEAKNS